MVLTKDQKKICIKSLKKVWNSSKKMTIMRSITYETGGLGVNGKIMDNL